MPTAESTSASTARTPISTIANRRGERERDSNPSSVVTSFTGTLGSTSCTIPVTAAAIVAGSDPVRTKRGAGQPPAKKASYVGPASKPNWCTLPTTPTIENQQGFGSSEQKFNR